MDAKRIDSIKIAIRYIWIVGLLVANLFGGNPITIDGLFTDWDEVPISYQDGSADGMGVDFADVKITYDNDFLFIYFSLQNGELLLQGGNSIHLYVDADGDSSTGLPFHGIGAELDWIFGSRTGFHYFMDGIISVSQNDLTLRTAPTITSQEFEISISRFSDVLTSEISNQLIQGSVVIADAPPNADIVPNEYGGVDFYIGEDYILPPVPITFEKNEISDIRVLTYNVLNSRLTDPNVQEYFQRIFTALNPDIVALQEMSANTDQLPGLFNSWFPTDTWYISNLFRDNIVLSKYPVLGQGYMTTSGRTMAVLLDTDVELGSNLLVFVSHLACCDNDESRQNDADEFVSTWRNWRESGNGPFVIDENTPFIHLGDFNLVGNRSQLITLTEGDIIDEQTFGNDYSLDWDGTSITDLFSRQTHIRMGYTWRRDNSSFSPGKLDYILFTDSVLEIAKHFVVNTITMDSLSLIEYELNRYDSYNASDHLVRVMDIIVPDLINIDNETIHPSSIRINNPYPNPFNPSTQITFDINYSDFISVNLFDLHGRLVRNISQEKFLPGEHTIWIQGNSLPSGVYFVQFKGKHFSQSYKLLLVK